MTTTVYEGDAIEMMRQLPDASIDMVLTDLPYGTTYAPWDSVIPMDALWTEWLRVTKPKAAIVLTASQPFTSALVMSQRKLFRCEWIWDKGSAANFANANRQPLKVHENVLVFATGQTTYNPQKTPGAKNHGHGAAPKLNHSATRLLTQQVEHDTTGMKFPKSIQSFPKHASQLKLHPTQKPVALFEFLIRTYSNEGDTVLDCTAGSGTTGEAAFNCNRHSVLIEREAEYVKVIRDRIAALTPQPAVTTTPTDDDLTLPDM
jgi:DNA modification methylase